MSYTGPRQADRNCPHCHASWHRLGDKCNKCGGLAPVPDEFYTGKKSIWKEGKATIGMGWDKKAHKVIFK
jgi:hypothetical protein